MIQELRSAIGSLHVGSGHHGDSPILINHPVVTFPYPPNGCNSYPAVFIVPMGLIPGVNCKLSVVISASYVNPYLSFSVFRGHLGTFVPVVGANPIGFLNTRTDSACVVNRPDIPLAMPSHRPTWRRAPMRVPSPSGVRDLVSPLPLRYPVQYTRPLCKYQL